MTNITLNNEQRLYVIPCGEGYTCLGFDVAFEKAEKIAAELHKAGWINTQAADNLTPKISQKGSLVAYADYEHLVTLAQRYHAATGKRLSCELTPQLIGLEGKRVEVVDSYGETRRFKVGKSTGWIPCHIELANARSSGGGAVYGAPFKSIRVIA